MTLKLFSKSVIFKIIITIVIFYSIIIWLPINQNYTFEAAVTQWDAYGYKEISKFGYVLNDVKFPDNIRFGAFYPGLPLILYFSNYFGLPYLIYFLNFVIYCIFSYVLYNFIVKKWYKDAKDDNKSTFIFWSFCLFPFSAFLHFNYTEIYFLLGAIWALDLILDKKVWKSQIPAVIIGFFRPTALPFGLFAWILYTVESYKNRANFVFKKYILESLGFLSYTVGTLCLYAFDQIKYGNWRLFYDSQQFFFHKKNNPDFIMQTIREVSGNVNMWYNNEPSLPEMINEYGFTFYGKEFNLAFLLWFPFTVAIIGSIVLIKQKKYYWLAYSWGLLIPTLLSNTVSFNRYLLTSFPLIFAFNELFYKNKLTQYFLLIVYSFFFLLTIVLFTHGFWVG